MELICHFLFFTSSLELELPDPDGGSPLLLDYSKNLINEDILKLLLDLAKSRKVQERRDEMYSAGRINTTENRAVLHIALRAKADDPPINLNGNNVIPDVTRVLNQMEQFCNDIIGGKWVGYSGKKITDVVNIGIGGSDLVNEFVFVPMCGWTCMKLHCSGTHLRIFGVLGSLHGV